MKRLILTSSARYRLETRCACNSGLNLWFALIRAFSYSNVASWYQLKADVNVQEMRGYAHKSIER